MTEEERKQVIKEHHQAMQKIGVAARLKNDPNTYKKMRAMRTERKHEDELKIEIE